ncbi:MAG: MHYT domain-containing protein, partial [Candidatus Binataceae bacterium]
MIRVYGCIIDQHDFKLVLLAGFLCLLASYTALSLFARARSITKRMRYFWLASTAVAAGTGVWATHFVAMLAFRPGLPLGYDLWLTAASVVIAVLVSGISFAAALNRRTAALGGALFGIAVGGMHFTGMSALQAHAVQHWDIGYVIASIGIGIAFGVLALSMTARLDEIPRRLATAGVLAVAICGHHFTAMGGAEPGPRSDRGRVGNRHGAGMDRRRGRLRDHADTRLELRRHHHRPAS